MTATEKLTEFARAVRSARDLRRVPVRQRDKNWPDEMRAANAKVDELLALHLADEQPADEQPGEQPGAGAGQVVIPDHPPAGIGAAPAGRADKPAGRRRGGQHND